ncbi:MAG: AAA family ATPase [Sulfuricella sp.]
MDEVKWIAPDYQSTLIENFIGTVPPRRWLVENRLPRGKAILLAAHGGVGKSYWALQLLNAIDSGEAEAMGGIIAPACRGLPCLTVFAEDDRYEVMLRLEAIRKRKGRKLGKSRIFCVPNMPDTMVLFRKEYDGFLSPTPAYEALKSALGSMALESEGGIGLVVIDTLTALAPVEGNSAEDMQQVMTYLGQLATQFDTTVLITHHLNKGGAGRDAASVRGSTAILAGVRGAYAMYQLDKKEAESVLEQAGMELGHSEVVQMHSIKSNGPVYKSAITYVRQEDGFLLDITGVLGEAVAPAEALLKVIAEANASGNPMSKSGPNGVYARKSDNWHPVLARLPRDPLAKLINALLEDGRVIQTGGKANLLGVAEA